MFCQICSGSKRRNCRLILAAWVGRPLLNYRRAHDIYLRLEKMLCLRGGKDSTLSKHSLNKVILEKSILWQI